MMDGLSQNLARSLAGQARAAGARGRPDWLERLCGQAGEQFTQNGLPGPGVERWKYTSLRTLERRGPRLAVAGDPPLAGAVPAPLLGNVSRVAMVDGAWSLLDGPVPPGLKVLPLGEALREGNGELRDMLESLEFDGSGQGFAALNTATLGQGLFIHVSRDVDAGALLLQWLSGGAGEAGLFNSRVCIRLEEGARFELLEQFESAAEDKPLLNLVLQCRLGTGSALRHTRLQQLAADAVLISHTSVQQAGDSRYEHTGLDLGGGLVRHDFHTMLAGAGAECSLHAGCLTSGRGHVDNHMDVEHLGPGCRSTQVFRGVLGDRSRAVFNGRVLVAKGADGAEARQSSAGLLLSPHAEIDAKPELEIHTDEVVASHGATVGQLDEDALFYLRSRGLDQAAARNILTMAFCRSVIDHLPSAELRAALGERLHAALQREGIANG